MFFTINLRWLCSVTPLLNPNNGNNSYIHLLFIPGRESIIVSCSKQVQVIRANALIQSYALSMPGTYRSPWHLMIISINSMHCWYTCVVTYVGMWISWSYEHSWVTENTRVVHSMIHFHFMPQKIFLFQLQLIGSKVVISSSDLPGDRLVTFLGEIIQYL
jgi:hypothetical protein